jgi:hypothetical protein
MDLAAIRLADWRTNLTVSDMPVLAMIALALIGALSINMEEVGSRYRLELFRE